MSAHEHAEPFHSAHTDDPVDVDPTFADFYFEHVRSVESFIRWNVRVADVDDGVIETFFIAWRHLADLGDIRNQRAWVLGIARNVARNLLRGERRRDATILALRDVTRTDSFDVEHTEATEELREVLDALRTLPAADREIIGLVAYEGLAAAELAIVLDISARQATLRLYRARMRLRRAVRDGRRRG